MENRRLQVVHVITTIERGGAENAVAALAQEQVRNGYEVFVVPLKGNLEISNDLIDAGIAVDTSLLGQSFIRQVRLFRKMYTHEPIFHGHLPRSELLLRLSKSKSSFFVTRHNAESFFPGAPIFFSRILSRLVTHRSSSVIAISQAVAHFLTFSGEISTKSQISVIYYGYKQRCNDAVVREFNLESKRSCIRIGTISRLVPQKNLYLLIELANKLKESHQQFNIFIVGAGPENLRLKKKIEEYGLESEVVLLGRKDNVIPFLLELDFFVLTSNYEGFGLVLLEAMDAKLPIIAARNSAIPEVLGDHHPGLFKTGDPESLFNVMFSVLHNPSVYEEIMRIQSHQLDSFSVTKYFESHHNLYLRMMTSRLQK